MSKALSYDHLGKQLAEVTLPAALFDVKVSEKLIAQAIHVYRSNSHQGFSKIKGRGEVDRTTAKWYKQKGTGRARHGARSAPIFVGGGVTFGPRNINAGNLKLTQKMKRLSLLGVFSNLAAGKVTLVNGFDKLEPKTSALSNLLTKMNTTIKPTILLAKTYPNVISAASNIKSINVIPYSQANAYLILNTRHLIIDESALDLLKAWLVAPAKKQAAVEEVKPVVKKVAVKKPVVKKTTTKKS